MLMMNKMIIESQIVTKEKVFFVLSDSETVMNYLVLATSAAILNFELGL